MLAFQISLQVMDAKAACQKLGVKYEKNKPVSCLSSICGVLATDSEKTT